MSKREWRFLGVGLLFILVLAVLVACGENQNSSATGQDGAALVTVYKSPTCGCCDFWNDYMVEHGFELRVFNLTDMNPIKERYAVPMGLQSCHTAVVDGYVIEGHVPAREIQRMLSERPAITGIAVPGMPIGSPGMAVEGYPDQAYNVVTFGGAQGGQIYASYAGQ